MTVARTLSDQDMVEILEEIAQNASNAAARIAAIRQLKEMADGEQPAEEDFAKLYDIAPGARRKAA